MLTATKALEDHHHRHTMASTTSTPNAAPTIIPPSFPVDLPKSATSAVGTRTLKIEGFPGGFFRDRPASIRSFFAANFGTVIDIEVQEEAFGQLDVQPSVDSYLTVESSPQKRPPPSPIRSPPRDERSIDSRGSADALSLFEQTSRAPSRDDGLPARFDSPSRTGSRGSVMGSRRRRFRPRAARPLARLYVRFEKQRSFERAFEALAGGSILFRDVMVDIECAYDASGYFTERRVMARRLAHEKRIRRATLDARRAAERPRTPPKAVMMQRHLFLWRSAVTTINERMADAVMRGGRPHKGESRAHLPRVCGERSMFTPLIFG